ncbi:RNA-binding family protein with RRM/RBD/RNP motifs [Prunus dulcis]|uniref:RNA-binding family protein with RRM/RBD/RNP motifs n=1 Tax=Prunus dulcis TaxID=3755 RepID=A0A5H2Y8Z8_PRUDU|nr:RNA-binding family protein with RRM/RBD/RNP motifs [Prunus dulcis]
MGEGHGKKDLTQRIKAQFVELKIKKRNWVLQLLQSTENGFDSESSGSSGGGAHSWLETALLNKFHSPMNSPAPQAREKAEPSTNLFVSGLSKRTTSEKLQEAFSQYATLEDAGKGIDGMDGKFLDGWVIFAEYARPRQPPPPPENNMSPPYSRY